MHSTVLPRGAWDCHVHCFDTERYVLKPSRAYTPKPALLEGLVQAGHTDQIMLVQATIEDGYKGLLHNLTRAKQDFPKKKVYGTIYADPSPQASLENVSTSDFDALHQAGVRSIRIHGSYGGSGTSLDWIKDQFRRVAKLWPISAYGWSICSQLPLASWAALENFLCHEPCLQNVVIVADHNGGVSPLDVGTLEFRSFLSLLKQCRLCVKTGALLRRSPDDIRMMQPVVEAFASAAPNSILWGSDWPHIDSTKGLEPHGPLEGVDTAYELQLLRAWMSEAQWEAMLVSNPERLFGV